MKRLALVAVAALAFAVLAALALSENSPSHPTPQRCKPGAVRAYTAKVWDQNRWRRGDPTKAAVLGFRARLACAPPGHRTELRHFWRDSQRDFYSARQVRLKHARVDPFYGCLPGGCHWAMPIWSVNCESGGGSASSNLYGNTQTYAEGMTKWQQDLAAHRLLAEYGGGADAYAAVWLAWEGGCAGYPGTGWNI